MVLEKLIVSPIIFVLRLVFFCYHRFHVWLYVEFLQSDYDFRFARYVYSNGFSFENLTLSSLDFLHIWRTFLWSFGFVVFSSCFFVCRMAFYFVFVVFNRYLPEESLFWFNVGVYSFDSRWYRRFWEAPFWTTRMILFSIFSSQACLMGLDFSEIIGHPAKFSYKIRVQPQDNWENPMAWFRYVRNNGNRPQFNIAFRPWRDDHPAHVMKRFTYGLQLIRADHERGRIQLARRQRAAQRPGNRQRG